MRPILCLALSLAGLIAGPAIAQSMNPPLIARQVMQHICGPFAAHQDLLKAVQAAQALEYEVIDRRPAGEPFTAGGKITLWRDHYGVISLLRRPNLLVCSVGVSEGSVASMARGAEQGLRDLGLAPALEDREGGPAILVWRGDGRQAVIVQTGHFGAGTELIVTIDPRVSPPGAAAD